MVVLCLSQYPKVGVDGDHVHTELHTLLQYLYKGEVKGQAHVSDALYTLYWGMYLYKVQVCVMDIC